MTGTTEIARAIAGERRELAEMLAGLPAEQWDAATLCRGWRVREVVAHMTMPFRTSLPRVLFELVKARGSFNRMADRCARRDASALRPDELVAALRDNADRRWKPPGGRVEDALAHDVIHGLDITVPLGLDRRVPEERLRIVLHRFDPIRSRRFFGVDLAGIALHADDTDWSFGSGSPLHGAAQDLLLVACGRRLPPGRLHGAAADRFTA